MTQRSEMETLSAFKQHTPVDVVMLIRNLGIEYQEIPMAAGESGRIDCRNGKYYITVNANEGPQRRRFTAAHELGHYLLHRDLLGKNGHLDRLFGGPIYNPEAPFNSWHETQANSFAAETLMPEAQIRRRWNRGENNVALLAQEFHVSRPAMRYRLVNLGLIDQGAA